MALLDKLFRRKAEVPPEPVPAPLPEPEAPRAQREAVYREAYVTYESGYKRRGVVVDHNETGVRLRFPTNERLPDTVILMAKAVNLVGPARLVWQKGSEVGLTLIED